MSSTEIVRAWKDPEYRALFSEVPPLPVGAIELDDPYFSENVGASKAFAFRRGEHTTITGCHTHCYCSLGCSAECHTHVHCSSGPVQCN